MVSPSITEHLPTWGEACGAFGWRALEGVVNAIPCVGCRQHGQALLSAMHDFANLQQGKPLFNADNYRQVATAMHQALMTQESAQQAQSVADIIEELSSQSVSQETRLPQCSPGQARRVERCLRAKKDDPNINPYAVCQHSVGCALPHRPRTEYGQELMRRPDLEEIIWDLSKKSANQPQKVLIHA